MAAFACAEFTAEHPANWKVSEREVSFPEGRFRQVRFIGPEEPYEIGTTEKGIGPAFVSPPEVSVTLGPLLKGSLKAFSERTFRELKQMKPTKPAATTVDRKEAFELFCEFTFQEPGFPSPVHLGRRILHASVRGRLVVITYTAHATQLLRFKNEASAIIDSLKFK